MAKLLTELFLIMIVGWLLLETYSLFLHGIERNRESSLNKISALQDKELKLSLALQAYTPMDPKSGSGYSTSSGRVNASAAWKGSYGGSLALSDNFQSPSLYSSPSAISSTYSSLLKEKEEVEQERENEQRKSFWELMPRWEAIVLGAIGIFGAALITNFANSFPQQILKILKWSLIGLRKLFNWS